MKKLTTLLALSALLVLPMAAIAEEDHAAHHPDSGEAAADTMNPDGATMGMDRQMQKMQDLMARIRETADPKERMRLMQEHMQAMHEGMKMMGSMRGGMGGMMGDRKGPAAKEGKAGAAQQGGSAKAGGMKGGMMKRHKMMQQRMDRMESMMEQMLEHEAMEREIESH